MFILEVVLESNKLAQCSPAPDVFSQLAAATKAVPAQPLTSEQAALVEALTRENPVAALSDSEYLQLLRTIVASERLAHGRLNTKSIIELSAWLDVLEGRSTRQKFFAQLNQPFNLAALASLRKSAVVAFAYARMLTEARKAPAPAPAEKEVADTGGVVEPLEV